MAFKPRAIVAAAWLHFSMFYVKGARFAVQAPAYRGLIALELWWFPLPLIL
jgi:hypothetical protein